MFKKNSSSAVLIVKNAILHREYSIFHIFMYEIPILTLQIHNLNLQALGISIFMLFLWTFDY
jgi:hypothetical protein